MSTVAVRPAADAPAIDAVRSALRTPGTSLPPELLEELQERFGADLREIRLHSDTNADRAARALHARALTVGRDILLARGEGDMHAPRGRRLLLHEVAHASQSPPARGAMLRLAPAAEARGHEARAERALAADARGHAPAAGAVAPGTILPLLQDAVLRPSASGATDPYTDAIASDIATSLSSAAVGAGARAQRRLSRMPEADRTAVLARVQSLLTPEQRERFAGALGQAADLEAQTPTAAPAQHEGEPEPATTQVSTEQPAREDAAPAIESGAEPATSTPVDAQALPATEPGAPEISIGADAGQTPAQPVEPQEQPQTPVGERPPQGPALTTPPPAGEDAAPPAAVDYGPIDSAGERALAHVGAGPEPRAAGATAEPAGAGIHTPASPGPSTAISDSDDATAALAADATALEQAAAHDRTTADGPAQTQAGLAAAATHAEPPATAEPHDTVPMTPPPSSHEAAEEQPPAPPSDVAPWLREAPSPLPPTPPSEAEAPVEQLTDAQPAATAVAEPTIAPAEIEPAPDASAAAGPEPEPATDPQPDASAAVGGGVESAAEPVAAAQSPAEDAARVDTQPADTQAAPARGAPADGAPPDGTQADGAPAEGGGESGGDCGPDTAPGVGGSGGGDGGGTAAAEPPQPVVADVSGAEPASALQQVSDMPPTRMQAALGSVRAASSRAVGAQRHELASDPPTVRTPDPLPPGQPQLTTAAGPARTERVPAAPAGDEPQPATTPQLPPAPQPLVAAPALPPAAAAITDEQARALQASVDAVPVTDPALHLDTGAAPSLPLTGGADPQGARDQHAQLISQGQGAAAQGAIDVAAPAGEDHLFPQRPTTTLSAPVAGAGAVAGAAAGTALPPGAGQAASAGAGPAPAAGGDRAIDALASESSGPAMSAAARQGVGSIAAGDEQQRATAAAARVEAGSDMQRQVAENRDAQAAERSRAQAAVTGQRTRWSAAQRDTVDQHRRQADGELTRATDGAPAQQAAAESQARAKIADGNTQIEDRRRTAERDARAKRDGAKQESSGVLGWLADRARSFFNALKEGIHAIFDLARSAINGIIQRVQREAFALIDAARNAIVGLIRDVGDRLIAIGDDLLGAFPGLRSRFRAAINALVDAAISRVNDLADGLENGLKRALAALAGALNAALNLLESVYQAAIDAVANVVNGAIESARAALRTLAQWGALVADIASNPVQWIRKLGAAALDGLRNHLWRELKCAVKAWFQSKVEEVLGLPLAIFGMLRRGGLKLAQIGRMVWEGLVSAIPGILINLAVEKIIAMLIPATGAIAAIIEFLQAAWPTLSRVFAAFERFFAFLQAVKTGNAGRKFAEMIAAGAVVVLDFLANFLVRRLKRPAQPVGGRLRALAERIMARIRSALGAVARTARRVVAAVGRGMRAAGRAIRRAAMTTVAAVRRLGGRALGALGRAGGRLMRTIERRFPRLGRFVRSAQHGAQRLVDRGRAFLRRQQDRYRAWRERRRARAQERLHTAVEAIRPAAGAMLRGGVGRLAWRAQLLAWQVRYMLRSLSMHGSTLVARVNPTENVAEIVDVTLGAALERVLQHAEAELLARLDADPTRSGEVDRAVAQVQAGTDPDAPLPALGFAQRVQLLRRVSSGRPVSPESFSFAGRTRKGDPRRIARLRRFEGDQAMLLVGWVHGPLAGATSRTTSLRSYYSVYPGHSLFGGFRQHSRLGGAPGSYASIARDAGRLERVLGPGTAGSVIAAASAPGRATQTAAIDLLIAQSPRLQANPQRASATRALVERSVQSLALVRAIESARMPGQMASQALSVAAGGTASELLLDDPMQGSGPAIAADVETGRDPDRAALIERARADEAAGSSSTPRAQRALAEHRAVTQQRRDRIVKVFARVAERVRSGKAVTEAGAQAQALQGVATAYERMLAALIHSGTAIDREHLATLEAEVTTATIGFLETFHGARQ